MYPTHAPDPTRRYEELLRDGITAAKNGQTRLAVSLLNQALHLQPHDARPYVWLSATTQDPEEQRDYLEKAAAIDPYNTAARRGLAQLTGKIAPAQSQPVEERPARIPTRVEEPVPARAQAFLCPQCGGHMSFGTENAQVKCQYCGYVRLAVPPAPPRKPESPAQAAYSPRVEIGEGVLDFVLPTTQAHSWATAQHRLACESCGAVTLLAPGERSVQCPYCGANQMIEAPEAADIIDPQAILPIQVNEKTAQKAVKTWLGRGLFAPDDLQLAAQKVKLRPAYYSCWVFSGTLVVRWSCQVKVGSGKYVRWEPRSGSEVELFENIFVPGVKALTMSELEGIEPFDLDAAQPFEPEFLAGWPALIYDRALSDASLLAREKVIKELRRQMHYRIEMGREKRGLQVSGGEWSGMSFRHVFVPVWLGTYRYKEQEFHVLVNGQSGKVGGDKPRDNLKLVMAMMIFTAVLALVTLLVSWGWELQGDQILEFLASGF